MANVNNLTLVLLLCLAGSLFICVSCSRGAFLLHDLNGMQVREDTRGILKKHGFDEPTLKYYWRRAMLEGIPTRLAPGGQQLEVEGDGDENVPSRRVFPSCYDGEHITGYTILEITVGDVFDRLHDEDVVSLYCLGILQLVLLGLIIVNQHFRISDLSEPRSMQGGPSSFQTHPNNNSFFNIGTLTNWQTPMPSQPGPSNWQSQMPAQSATPYWQPAFPSHPGGYNWQSPISSHMGGDDVIFLDGEFTGNYLVYENVEPQKHMNAWMKLLIRCRSNNDPWTVAYTNTISVHPENQRFLIEMDQHTIGTLDGSTRPYPALLGTYFVFLPIHVGGNHWVTSVIDLPNAYVYVLDSLPNEGKRNLLWNQFQRWTPMVNNILQGRERSAIVNGDPQEFWETVRNNMCQCFYLSRCEDTRDCGYD
nr:hypothetical protein [Tanacetum cinerariifolium]